ncbi:MAG: PorV/PorQ family protein, partial [Fidelibacterota bacterium]
MKRFVSLFIFISFVFYSSLYGQGFEKVGRSGAKFLQIGVGARAEAMGEAFVAISDDISAIFWNPGGLTYIDGTDFIGSYIKWPADILIHSAAFATKVEGFGTVGVFGTVLSMGDMRVRTAFFPDGTGEMFTVSDVAVGLSYATHLTDKFSIGANFKYVREDYYNETSQGWAVDVGTIYETGFRGVRLGMSILNWGPDIKFSGKYKKWSDFETPGIPKEFEIYSLPLLFRFGLSVDFIQEGPNRLVAAFDAMHPSDNAESANIGIEYVLADILALRGGYKINVDEG